MIARGARLALHIVMLVASSSNGGNAISARALVRITRFRARVQVECTNTRRTLFTTILFAVIVDSGLAIVASAFQIKLGLAADSWMAVSHDLGDRERRTLLESLVHGLSWND